MTKTCISVMPHISLSICIPTYNFGNYIGETLRCFIGQLMPGIEIVVLDGGSTDNTRDIVCRYQQECSSLFYYKQNFKGGIDKDIARVVSLARGEYCWLMSSDDLIRPDALRRVFSEIQSGNDIYLCNKTECDFNMKPVCARYNLKKSVKDRLFNLHDSSELRNYLNLSISIGAFFSYMSSIIFKKSRWDEVPDRECVYGTCYAHAYTLLSLIQHNCTLKYIREPLVLWRGGNDSFCNNSYLKRVLIDFEGYKKIADKIFIDDAVMNAAFKDAFKKIYPLYKLVKLRAFTNDSEWKELVPVLIGFDYKPMTILICELLKHSKPCIDILIKMRQVLRITRSSLHV
jgi:abequosyltransferase